MGQLLVLVSRLTLRVGLAYLVFIGPRIGPGPNLNLDERSSSNDATNPPKS